MSRAVHLDYFDPQHFSDRHIDEFGGSNRFATVLSYLTGDPEADQGLSSGATQCHPLGVTWAS